MKKRILALALAVGMLLLAGCGTTNNATGETQTFTLKVTHGDGTEFTTEVTTDKQTVGEALVEARLLDGEKGAYGLYVTTVDSETADESKEEWWCMTKDGGQQVNTGVDSTAVEAGVTYEFTLMKGF